MAVGMPIGARATSALAVALVGRAFTMLAVVADTIMVAAVELAEMQQQAAPQRVATMATQAAYRLLKAGRTGYCLVAAAVEVQAAAPTIRMVARVVLAEEF